MSIARRGRSIALMVAVGALLALAGSQAAQAGITPFSATLTIVKVTDPASDPQDFDFDITGAAFSDLDLDTDGGDATLPSQFQVLLSTGGPITIVESAAAGWDLTGLVCTGDAESSTTVGTRTATIDADHGENIICTFTNTKHASLTVTKQTDPATDPQDFDFDLTGAGIPSDLDLDTDGGNATLPSQQTFNLNASQLGAHSVSESLSFGWSLTSLECAGAGDDSSTSTVTRTATLDIDAGENVACTFGNTKNASLTVVKVTSPASDPQDFDFDVTGADQAPDLDLDTDAGDATLPSQESFIINAAHLGAHSITESATAGWALTNLDCSGAGADSSTDVNTRTATLDIDAGENVVCTFENTKIAGALLTIRKVTDPAADPQDFDFGLTGAGVPADLDLDTDAGNATLPSQQSFSIAVEQLGAYSITEDGPAGWDLTSLTCDGAGADSSTNVGTSTATLDIDLGEIIVCTFTNTKHASLTIVKITSPAADPQDFDFDLTGAGLPADLDLDTAGIDSTLPSQQSFSLNSTQLGAHTVTETAIPGWVLTNLECTGAGADSSTTLGDRVATLDIDAGETVVCTFTNTKATATITVVKATDPASDPQDFDFDVTGAGAPTDIDLDSDAGSASLASQRIFDVSAEVPSLYTISESTAAGWTLTSIVCIGGGEDSSTSVETRTATINLDGGEHVTCTFTNTKHTQLTITKVTDPAEHAQDFYFDLTSVFNTTLDTDTSDATNPSTDTVSLPPSSQGQRDLIEDAYPGWTVTNIVCTGDNSWGTEFVQRRAQLTLDPGENISCTFTNTFVGLGTDPPATDPPATDPPATDPPATDPPATDPPATDPPATDPPGSPDPTDDNAGETDTPSQPGSDTAAKEAAAATGNNVLLLVLALGILGGILLITRPKNRRR